MNALRKQAKALREKSAAAYAAAKVLRDEFTNAGGEVPQDKMAQFNAAIEESTKAIESAQQLETQADALDKLEEQHSRPINALPTSVLNTSDPRVSPERAECHRAAFHLWAKGDRDEARSTLLRGGFTSQECHALIAGDDTKGGFLIPTQVSTKVIERRAGLAVMRGLVEVVPTGRDVVDYPRIAGNSGSYPNMYPSGYAGDWDNEQGGTTETGGAITVKTQQNQPTTEMVKAQVHNWVPNPVIVSMSMLEDPAMPFETILARHMGTTAALDEDYQVLLGNGVNQPIGILTNTDVTTTYAVNSGSNSGVTYQGLLDLIYGLPAQYAQGAVLLMRRATFGKILGMETTANDLVFKGMQIGIDNLMGYPVKFSDFMPVCTTQNNLAAIFGNFMDGYFIADRQDMRVMRLNERYYPNVGFAPTARYGGNVKLPEAFRTLKISA